MLHCLLGKWTSSDQFRDVSWGCVPMLKIRVITAWRQRAHSAWDGTEKQVASDSFLAAGQQEQRGAGRTALARAFYTRDAVLKSHSYKSYFKY